MSRPDEENLGPKETADDATAADMGLGGTPATSATPIGQGDEEGTGARTDREASQGDGTATDEDD